MYPTMRICLTLRVLPSWVTLVVGILLCPPAIAIATSDAGDTPSMDDIHEAFRTRTKAANSFIIEWKESASAVTHDVATAAGDLTDASNPEAAAMAVNGARKRRSLEQGGEFRLVVEGTRMRFEDAGSEPSFDNPMELLPKKSVQVFEGNISKRLFEEGASAYPKGLIRPSEESRGFPYVGAVPVLIALQPSIWLAPIPLDRMSVTATQSDNGAVALVEVKPAHPHDSAYTLWCDPQMDYQPTRIEVRRQAILRRRYDLSYERKPEHGIWVPVKWTGASWESDGSLRLQKTSEVLRISIGGPIAEEEFTLRFPVGTYVTDLVRQQRFIVLAGGQERIVTEGEQRAGLTYRELMTATSDARRTTGRKTVLIVSGAVGLVALIGVLFYMRR